MKILLIEDEAELAANISLCLSEHGYLCEVAANSEDSLTKISLYTYDCILLDLMLPDGNGLDVLLALRKEQRTDGVIIISAKENVESRVEGLRLGADDYITKPFYLSELVARIHALIRRKISSGNNIIRFNEIEIDLHAKEVSVYGSNLVLTKKEFELLLYLISNTRRVVSKISIAEHLSGELADMMITHDFVYAHIKNLKKKLAESGCEDYIKTVYGLGYKWQ